jgi:hypothetical protein
MLHSGVVVDTGWHEWNWSMDAIGCVVIRLWIVVLNIFIVFFGYGIW